MEKKLYSVCSSHFNLRFSVCQINISVFNSVLSLCVKELFTVKAVKMVQKSEGKINQIRAVQCYVFRFHISFITFVWLIYSSKDEA